MRIAIAADHNGTAVKAELIAWLASQGHEADDRGPAGPGTVDYPPLCADVCRQVLTGSAERGIVVGGTGSGEQIACNKIAGIRAGLCHDLVTAEIARAHNDTNVLVMGAKIIAPALALRITGLWLVTPFKGGRHQLRLDQIAALERGEQLGAG